MSDLIDAKMLSDWRINYGLVGRTHAEAMRWWHDNMDGKAPAGAVAALGLCIDEIERLTAENERLRGLLLRYRLEVPLGHQPHMIAHQVDELMAKEQR